MKETIIEKVFKIIDNRENADQLDIPIITLAQNKSLSGNKFICFSAYEDENDKLTGRLYVATGGIVYSAGGGTSADIYRNIFSSTGTLNRIEIVNGTTSDCGYNKAIMRLIDDDNNSKINIQLYKSSTSDQNDFVLKNNSIIKL